MCRVIGNIVLWAQEMGGRWPSKKVCLALTVQKTVIYLWDRIPPCHLRSMGAFLHNAGTARAHRPIVS